MNYTLRKKCQYSELFWSAFSRIRAEYGEVSPASGLNTENYLSVFSRTMDQNNSEYGHLSHSDKVIGIEIEKRSWQT